MVLKKKIFSLKKQQAVMKSTGTGCMKSRSNKCTPDGCQSNGAKVRRASSLRTSEWLSLRGGPRLIPRDERLRSHTTEENQVFLPELKIARTWRIWHKLFPEAVYRMIEWWTYTPCRHLSNIKFWKFYKIIFHIRRIIHLETAICGMWAVCSAL